MKQLSYKLQFETENDDSDYHDAYWDSGKGAAGCIFISKDTGRILLGHRSDMVNEPGTWGTWGGKIDGNESVLDAITREVEEETGYNGRYKVTPLWTFEDPERGFQYHNYLVLVPYEFTPELNWENDDSRWIEWGEWPTPLHFGLKALLENASPTLMRVIKLIKPKHAEVVESLDLPPAAIIQKAAINSTIPLSITNAYVLAATVWREAQGEGREGMQAVLNTIMNRSKGQITNAVNVILKPKQFSTWNGITNPVSTALTIARDNFENKDPTWIQSMKLVDLAIKGKLNDITGGALFYFNPHKVIPSWAKKLQKTTHIGNHDFYKVPSSPEKKRKCCQRKSQLRLPK